MNNILMEEKFECKEKIVIMHVAQAAGGVDRYLKMLLKNLDKTKFFNICICSKDYKEDDYQGLADEFISIDMRRNVGIHDILSIKNVRRYIKKYKPNIVYAHSSKAGLYARVGNIGLKSTCIYNPHGWAFNMRCSNSKRMLYRFVEKRLSIFCKKIICISEAEKNSAISNGICDVNKLVVINNGIELCYKKLFLSKESIGIPSDSYVIGMVGRISEQKAPDIFIRMAKLIKNKICNAYFIMVGSGDMEEEIIDYAKNNGLKDSLLITGWTDNPMQYVDLFDVAVLLSRWEGFGLVLPEYMLARKPIVATAVDAIPYIIRDKENGMLVEQDSEVSAYNAVIELYSNDELRAEIVEQAYKEVFARFDAKRVSKEHEKLFDYLFDKIYYK